jgi:hypothetical protein
MDGSGLLILEVELTLGLWRVGLLVSHVWSVNTNHHIG